MVKLQQKILNLANAVQQVWYQGNSLVAWMQELNATSATSLMIVNWEVLFTFRRDERPCRGIYMD